MKRALFTILLFFVTKIGIAVASPASPQPGLWWNPQESGRGFAIDPQGDKMVVTVFGYDDSGTMRWYYADGPLTAGGFHWSGQLLKFDRGQPLNGGYQAPQFSGSEGVLTLDFTSRMTGFATLPGGRRIPIERQNFGAGDAPMALLGQWSFLYLIGSSTFADTYVLGTMLRSTSTGNGVVADTGRNAAFEYQVSGTFAGSVVGFHFSSTGAVLDQYVFSLMLEEGRGDWISPVTFNLYGMNAYKTHTASGMSKMLDIGQAVSQDLSAKGSASPQPVSIEKLIERDPVMGELASDMWAALQSPPNAAPQ